MSHAVPVLYIDTSPTSTRGGAQNSLLFILKHIDRTKYSPFVLMYLPHGIEDELNQLSVPFLIVSNKNHYNTTKKTKQEAPIHYELPQNRLGTYRDLGFRLKYILKHEWRRFWAVRKYAYAIQAKLIYLNGNYTTAHGAILAAKTLGIPVIAHQRILSVYTIIDRHFSRHIDFMIMYTQKYMQKLLELGVKPKRCDFLYNAVRLDQLPGYSAESEMKYRNEFGFKPNIPIITQVGNVDTIRGHDLSIAAAMRIWNRDKPFYLLLVGEIRDPDYLQYLQSIYNNTGMEPHVVFTGFRSDAVDILSVSTISLEATYMEAGFTRVVIESLALGKTLVAPEAGCSEIITHQENGFLYKNGSVDDMAESLSQALHADHIAIGTQARKTAIQHFDINNMMSRYHEILDSVIQH